MPLKKGKSKNTVSKNVETEMKNYKKTGKIGTSKPASNKKAAKQAAAVAYSKAGKSKKKINEGKKNDGNLANNYPPYDKVTKGDIVAGAKGEDQMGGKKDKKKKKSLKESFDSFIKTLLKKVFITE
jgi:hypothetical protein